MRQSVLVQVAQCCHGQDHVYLASALSGFLHATQKCSGKKVDGLLAVRGGFGGFAGPILAADAWRRREVDRRRVMLSGRRNGRADGLRMRAAAAVDCWWRKEGLRGGQRSPIQVFVSELSFIGSGERTVMVAIVAVDRLDATKSAVGVLDGRQMPRTKNREVD